MGWSMRLYCGPDSYLLHCIDLLIGQLLLWLCRSVLFKHRSELNIRSHANMFINRSLLSATQT